MNQLHLLSDAEWREAISQPGEVLHREREDEDIGRLLKRENDQFIYSVERLAQRNDIESLQQVLDVGASQWSSRVYKNGERGKLCYATAHMLIDGAGNDGFATKWMATIGHSEKLAREHLFDVFLTNSMLPAVDVFMQTHVDIQNWLGVASLAGDVFKLHHDGSLFLKAGDSSSGLPETDSRRKCRPRLCAELLRRHSPEKLPDFGTEDGLSDLVWRNAFKGSYYLPAIELAYGPDNEVIRRQLVNGLDLIIKSERFELETSTLCSERWEGIRRCGNPQIAHSIFNSVVLYPADGDEALGVKPKRKMSFTDACKKISETMFVQVVEVLGSIGHDMDAVSRDFHSNKGCRLIDVAAENYNARVFNHLVGSGASNPTEPCRRGVRPPSAHVRMAMKKKDRLTEGCLKSVTEMDDMLRAWEARNAAEHAMRELDVRMTP